MTGRERVSAIMKRRPHEGLSWTTLVDETALASLPEDMKWMNAIDFYKHIGCDIIQWGGWCAPAGFDFPRRRWPEGVSEERFQEDGDGVVLTKTPTRALKAVLHRNGHPVKHPVETIEDVKAMTELWEGASCEDADETAAHRTIDEAVGERGIVVRTSQPSAIPRLLEYDMGMENFYSLLMDHPAEMEFLISAMHSKDLEMWRALARSPGEVGILVENTSTHYISPRIYEKYNRDHVRDFVEIMHGEGKVAIIHMCGHIKDLLGMIKGTGLDGIDTLTPPLIGNTPYELALDVLGEELVVIGTLDPALWHSAPMAQLGPALDALYTPRLRRANFILGCGGDGVPIKLDRFQAIAAWFAKNGRA